MNNNKISRLAQIIGLSVIFDIIVFDQISKWAITELVLRPISENGGESMGLLEWIMSAPEKLGFVSTPIFPNFNLTMVWNHGVSFGLMNDMGIWPLVIMAVGICGVFFSWLGKTTSMFECVSLGMIIGGAIGNVIDRFRFGAVADFFDVYVGTYHWPAFNIADSAISIGVVMLLIHGLFMDKKDEK